MRARHDAASRGRSADEGRAGRRGNQDGCRRRRCGRRRSSAACAWRPAGERMPSCATVLDAGARARRRGGGRRVADRVGRHRHPRPGRAGHRPRRARREPRRRRARPRGGGRRPQLGVPVRVENDVKAAALGAYALARRPIAARWRTSTSAPGIAAGIVTDGELWRGARGTAGEVGHISIDPNGPLCRCGQRGCIEALAGGGADRRALGPPRRAAGARRLRRRRRGRPARPRTARRPRARRRGGRARARADRRRRRRRARRRSDGAGRRGSWRMSRPSSRPVPRHPRSCARCASRSGSSCCRPGRRPRRSAPRSSVPPATREEALAHG